VLDADAAARKILDIELKDLLASWFGVGFLELRRITWDSSAELLERLIAYEAVHHIQSWSDLKNRLDSDRRCFGFFHPRMPGEPLIFVEVALVNGLADNVHDLLDETAPPIDPATADTAIFYSISNAQRGLAGISLGNFLIKRVVDLLRQEFPKLATFSTLSPMPGFRRWLKAQLDTEAEMVSDIVSPDLAKLLREQLDLPWFENPDTVEALRTPLLKLGARYIVNGGAKGRVADPVGHFHLTNGARFERLNFLADRSENGMRQSAGMMINYLYKLDEIDANHEAYSDDGTVATGSQVRGFLKS
jgi:malonyl-CoA decarboxylase